MPLDQGLKVPKGGYIEDQLRKLVNSTPVNDFLRTGQDDDLKLLKQYQLAEQFDDYVEISHHGRNLLAFLDALAGFDTENPAPLHGLLYAAAAVKIDMEFQQLERLIFEDMKEQLARIDTEGVQATLFLYKPLVKLEILNHQQFDSSQSVMADPNIPLSWLLYPEKGSIMVITSMSRMIEPIQCATRTGQALGELCQRNSVNYQKMKSQIGLYLSPS